MTELPQTMFGVYLTGHGGPENLEFRRDIPVPTPGPNDVVVRVAAAGVNNTDLNTRTGWYSKKDASAADAGWSGSALKLPLIQGADVCGHIAAVGNEVDTARLGQRVLVEPCLWEFDEQALHKPWYLGSECNGGFAEYTRVPSRYAHGIDSALSDEELASFPCSYSTAENMLTRAEVMNRDKVLITGASGGVGSAALQLVKARGGEALALSSASKAGLLAELGADLVIDRDLDLLDQLEMDSIDVVIDLVGGTQWPKLPMLLRPGGRYATAGAIAGPLVELDLRTLYLKDLSLFGCTVLEPEVFPKLIRHIKNGEVKPLLAQTFPLSAIAKAQQAFQEKNHIGKIVLTMDC